jgi:hypothetical protein
MPSRRATGAAVVLVTAAMCAAAVTPAAAAVRTGPTGPAGPAAASTTHRCQLPAFGPGRSYRPRFDRAGFTAHVTNRYFPLVVGRTMIYAGTKDGKRALDVVVVTGHTRRIDGVVTRVVEDRLYLDAVLEERTRDYYAQDRCGNVWYFGEDTATLDAKGRVTSRDGSFHAGLNGAQPGLFMQRHPQVGRWFRQEWAPGEAEDTFRAVGLGVVTVPYGRYRRALRTQERTALEPGVVDAKYYVTGVGEVYEGSVRGPKEQLRLVEIIR